MRTLPARVHLRLRYKFIEYFNSYFSTDCIGRLLSLLTFHLEKDKLCSRTYEPKDKKPLLLTAIIRGWSRRNFVPTPQSQGQQQKLLLVKLKREKRYCSEDISQLKRDTWKLGTMQDANHWYPNGLRYSYHSVTSCRSCFLHSAHLAAFYWSNISNRRTWPAFNLAINLLFFSDFN